MLASDEEEANEARGGGRRTFADLRSRDKCQVSELKVDFEGRQPLVLEPARPAAPQQPRVGRVRPGDNDDDDDDDDDSPLDSESQSLEVVQQRRAETSRTRAAESGQTNKTMPVGADSASAHPSRTNVAIRLVCASDSA